MDRSFVERLDEIDQKYREPEKKKKKKKKKQPKPGGLNGFMQKFNDQQAKGNVKTTLLKTIADVAGVGLGTAVSAAFGKAAPLVGAALIGTGHYIGDNSGLLRVVGAATLAHSVAKSKEYRQEGSTMKDRLSGLKDDWLRTAMLKHEEQKKQTVSTPAKTEVRVEPSPSIFESASNQTVSKSNEEPFLTPDPVETVETVQTPLTGHRKTPYEIEIDQRLFEMHEESQRLKAELEEDETPPDEFDNSTEDDLTNDNYLPPNHNGFRGKTIWPPDSPTDHDDYWDDDLLNFNDY